MKFQPITTAADWVDFGLFLAAVVAGLIAWELNGEIWWAFVLASLGTYGVLILLYYLLGRIVSLPNLEPVRSAWNIILLLLPPW